MNEIFIYKNDLSIGKSNVFRRATEKRALDILFHNKQIDENTYSKLQQRINVKYAKKREEFPHLTM